MSKSQIPITSVGLAEHLNRAGKLEAAGGCGYISSLDDGIPRIDHSVLHDAQRLREDVTLRRLAIFGYGLIETANERQIPGRTIEEVVGGFTNQWNQILGDVNPLRFQQRFHTVEELPEGGIVFLIDGILPEGVTFIGGLSGVGKTWFALSMARALITGGKFLGKWDVPEASNVLYLVPEMNARPFRNRCEKFGISGERFRCMTLSDGAPLNLDDPLLLAAIRNLRPVVFLDTTMRFSKGRDENSASENQELAKAIFGLIHAGARAVVCLHHRSKREAASDEMNLENALRGSGDIGAMADCVWGLQYDRRARDGGAYAKESKRLVRLQVRCVKARDFCTPDDFRIQVSDFIDQSGDVGLLGEETVVEEADRLAGAIESNPKATKVSLQEITGIHRNRLEKIAATRGWKWSQKSGWHREESKPM